MAYEGGYPAQRPYPGPGAQRPGPPLEAYHQGPPQHYDAPQQQYDGYQDNYAYDQYDNGGYGQNYGGQHHHDQGYGRGPPPNQQYPPQDRYGPGPGPGPGQAPLSLLEAALLALAEALQMVHRQEVAGRCSMSVRRTLTRHRAASDPLWMQAKSVLTRLEDSAAPFRFSLAISAGQILNKSQI
ncbi:hypothetical protein VdG2_00501 [Verticillium dahliae VDG2]|nr:hypothetical protein VdG2_00501 [Verticillium dahliae VDG2]